jgi:hypothetical protein
MEYESFQSQRELPFNRHKIKREEFITELLPSKIYSLHSFITTARAGEDFTMDYGIIIPRVVNNFSSNLNES